MVVVKQGEHGAAMYTRDGFFGLPAFPTPDVVDPTGAGDSFAGGFMGYVAAHADEEIDDELLRRAMAYGTALASFNVEAFGTERMQTLTGDEVARARRRSSSGPRASTPRRSLSGPDLARRRVRSAYHARPMGWTMLYLFVFLKLPILAACCIVWWAIRQGTETEDVTAPSDGGAPAAPPPAPAPPPPPAPARAAAARTPPASACRRPRASAP